MMQLATLADPLGQLAGGFRAALTLLAVMSLLSVTRWAPDAITHARRQQAQRLNKGAWTLVSISIIAYSPAHAGWLLGHPVASWLNRALDLTASALACAAFIRVLAYRGLMRGLSWPRVRNGMRVNAGITVAVVGAAWLIP